MAEAAVTRPGWSDGPDHDEVVHAAASALDRIRHLHDALIAIRVDARSEAGDIGVTVDGSGALVDLVLEPAALSRPGAELGRVIVETAEAAARGALLRHGELIREHGADRAAPGHRPA